MQTIPRATVHLRRVNQLRAAAQGTTVSRLAKATSRAVMVRVRRSISGTFRGVVGRVTVRVGVLAVVAMVKEVLGAFA